MRVSAHFELKEFVDPATYQMRGDKSIGLIDHRIITLAEFFREYFELPVIINNWHAGGRYKESGLRTFLSKTGATFSQHKYGRAIDMKIPGISAEDIRKQIRLNWPIFKKNGLTTIEKDTPTWVHIDCRYTAIDELFECPYK